MLCLVSCGKAELTMWRSQNIDNGNGNGNRNDLAISLGRKGDTDDELAAQVSTEAHNIVKVSKMRLWSGRGRAHLGDGL